MNRVNVAAMKRSSLLQRCDTAAVPAAAAAAAWSMEREAV